MKKRALGRNGFFSRFGHVLGILLILLFILTVNILVHPVDEVEAHMGQASTTKPCTQCHTGAIAGATITAGINGTTNTSISLDNSVQQTFEVDYFYTGARGPSDESVGHQIGLPDTTWSVSAGTSTSPTGGNFTGNWHTSWDSSGGAPWQRQTNTNLDWVQNYGGTAWDFDTKSNDTACDMGPTTCDGGSGGSDLDGVAEKMGTDATITIPAGFAPGNYTVTVYGIGHDSGSGKAQISTTLSVNITGNDTDPPTFTGLDSTTNTTLGGEVALAWTAATDPSGPITYNIYWSTTTPITDFSTPNATVGSTSYTASGLTNGTPYYFVVRAEDSIGNETTNTTETSATPTDTTPPTGFTGIGSATSAATDGEVNLSWSNAGVADNSPPVTYNIYWSTTTPITDFSTPDATVGGTSYTASGLTNGTPYYFVVRARDSYGNEETNTNEATATPTDTTPPTGFTGIGSATDAATNGEVNLSWSNAGVTDSSPPVTYNIYWSTTTPITDFSTPNATVGGTSYTASGLTNDTPYYFIVRARDFYGNEETNTNEATATPTLNADTDPPTGFTGIDSATNATTGGEVNLAWSNAGVSDASPPITYNIYWSTTTPITDFSTPNATVGGTSYTASGLTNGTPYYFVVRARDSIGNEETNTNEATATPTDTTPPTGFTGIGSATNATTGGEVNLAWSNAGVADNSPPVTYNIYWSTTTPITDFSTPNATVGGTSYTASGLTNGTPYYFVVRARDSYGNEETNTNEATATPTDTTPPTGFTGIGSATNAATDGEVNLAWSNAGVADNSPPVTYNIYWSTTTPITDFSTPNATVGGTSYTASGLTNGTPYYFVVRARDSYGNEETNTNEATATPTDTTPPTGFTGIGSATDAATNGEVNLSWSNAGVTDSSPPVTYNIYWSTTTPITDFSTPNATVGGTSYTASGLTNDTPYYFIVRARDFYGNEETNTNEATATPTLAPDTDPPTGFTGIGSATNATTGGEVNLSWSNAGVSDASPPVTYNIYWSTTTPITDFSTPNATVGGTSYTASGLTNGTPYYFVVRARDSIGNEETNTNQASATPTDTTPPQGFTGLNSATDAVTNGEVILTWTTAGVTDGSPPITYNVYWSDTPGGPYTSTNTSSSPYTVTGLINDTPYYFVVKARDSFGNETTNTAESSATPTLAADQDPPSFGGISSAVDAATDGQVTLGWNAASDASGPPITYNIYVSTTSGNQAFGSPPYATVDDSTSITVSNLDNNQIYYFVVRAEDQYSNEESNVVELSATPSDHVIPSFNGVSTAADANTNGAVDLTWNTPATDSSAPITYNVYVATSSGGHNYISPYTTTQNATGVTVTNLTNTVTYYFVVRAEDPYGNEELNTTEVSATPTDGVAPTFGGLLTATDNTNGGEVDLVWPTASDPSTPIQYNVYLATTTGGQNFGGAPYVSTNETTGTTVTGLVNDQNYYFVVRAQDAAGNEDTNTTERFATPTVLADSDPPTFGGIATATDRNTDGEIMLTWGSATDPSTPITYNVYVSTTPGGQNFGAIDRSTADTWVIVDGLSNGQAYYFVVRAEDSQGNEDTNTTELSATPTESVPPLFSGISSATDANTDGAVDVAWSTPAIDSSLPITYNIYVATTSGGHDFVSAPHTSTQNVSGVTVSGLANGTTYFFVVRAEDAYGNEETNTAEATATPTLSSDSVAPTFGGLNSANDANTDGAVTLAWSAATDPSTPITYNVYVATSSGGQSFLAAPYSTTTNGSGTTVSGLSNGTEYFFVVRAKDSAGNEDINTVEFSATPSVGSGDVSPPDDIADLTVSTLSSQIYSSYLLISWTAPGDDGTTGTATTYDIRYSESPIIDDTSWNTATQVPLPPAPQPAGTSENFYVTGLESNTVYYFAIKTADEIPNSSSFSNSPYGKTGLLSYSWNMISSPFTPNPPQTYLSEFSDDNGNAPSMWAYSAGAWVDPGYIEPGKGVMIYSYKANTPTDVTGPTNTNAFYDITLEDGWNFVANPYLGGVNLSDCLVDSGSGFETYEAAVTGAVIANALQVWDGSTYTWETWDVAVLDPWKAYWVFVDNVGGVTLRINKP